MRLWRLLDKPQSRVIAFNSLVTADLLNHSSARSFLPLSQCVNVSEVAQLLHVVFKYCVDITRPRAASLDAVLVGSQQNRCSTTVK
mmetsp:Transcript_2039/g.4835  ORF Transcript_2039/g.4835 Transcript_2039/m.4835 type:complete len:86 (-) Transcript_2039:15-272(-)